MQVKRAVSQEMMGCYVRHLTLQALQAGYAVIFLNRRHSIQPFTKGLPSGEIMDTLTDVLDCNGGSTLRVKDDATNIVRQAMAKAKQVLTQISAKKPA